MSKNTYNCYVDYSQSWPDLNNKTGYHERRNKHSVVPKITNPSANSKENNTNKSCNPTVDSTDPTDRTNTNNQCNSNSHGHLSTTTSKQHISKDVGLHPNVHDANVLSTGSGAGIDICNYWNRIEDFKHYYQNCHNPLQTSQMNFYNYVKESTQPHQIVEATTSTRKTSLSREEIVIQRRIKVAARRQQKKEEKQQLKAIVSGVQAAKPDFSLEQAAEDFPALSSGKKFKKTRKVTNFSLNNETKTLTLQEVRPNTIVEKSWKPKIKDPINIDISQALQTTKPEKPKLIVKKADATIHRNVLVGNILDSDNPQRRKGKVRPDKVRKPSKLKGLILSERIERRKRISETENVSLDPSKEPTPLIVPPDLHEDSNDEICKLLAKCAFLETDITPKPVDEVENLNNQPVIVSETSRNIHSRKFREYCTNCLTEDLITSVCGLLEKVAQFQDRMFAQNPIKASAKRRYVAGINQTKKYLLVKKVKLLVIAPDLEKNPAKNGLDEKINYFIKEAECQGVTCVFGPNRKRLGKAVFKNSLVSCVGVLSYDGAQELFFEMHRALNEAKSKYQALTISPETLTEKEEDGDYPIKARCPTDDITSAFLAKLRGDLTPADKLLKAIEDCSW